MKPPRSGGQEAQTREDPWVGRQIAGRYRIERALGEGGMGSIFLAEHLTLGRKVALKVLLEELAQKESIKQRFEREAKTLSALHHPNIVAVSDYGVDGETRFIVMELAKGEDLAKALEVNRPTPAQAYEVFRQLLRGVGHAHAEGLVHRDLKPSNVMVRFLGDGSIHVQVLDFGLARFDDDSPRGGPQLTRAGAILGTPAYMAPEQASGEGAIPASDTYAAGLILYEMLAGRRPFDHREPTALLRAHLMEEAPPLQQTAAHLVVPPELEAFLAKALAKERNTRFANASEMLQAFDRLPLPTERSSQPSSGLAVGPGLTIASGKHAAQTLMKASKQVPKVAWIAAAGALVLIAILGVVMLSGGEDPPVTPPIAQPGVAAAMSPTAMAPSMDAPTMEPAPTMEAAPTMAATPTMEATPTMAASANRWSWQGELPREVQAAHARLMRSNRRLPRSVEGQLLRYSRSNPEDPRPHLLLGRSYGNGRALTDAVGEYRDAYERDPNMRHDASMKDHLVEASIANTDRLRRAAQSLITTAYGRGEIQGVIQARMGNANRDERRRLEQLLGQLR
ncbi:MAG: protein kinase [Deltaproteobacteria bacterium]|nr:protein kinase [Deltaproteobacteria bacterium]